MKARPNPVNPSSGCLGIVEGRLGTILAFIVLPLLVCVIIAISLAVFRTPLLFIGAVSISPKGAEIKDPDGTTLIIPEGAVTQNSSIKLSTTTPQNFLASSLAQTLPAHIEVKSALYNIAVQGENPTHAKLSVPIPNDSESDTTPLDLYGLYAQQWLKLPFILNQDAERLESDLNFVPEAVFVAQTKAQAPTLSAWLASKNSLPADAASVLAQVNPTGLRLADEGALAGDVLSLPETSPYSPYAIIPTVTNVDEQRGPRLDLTENMLNDETQRTAHIRTLVDLAVQKLYLGYNLSYEGLAPADEEAFVTFVKELARELHAQQKILSVTLPLPQPVAENEWDTAGYNWVLIGRYADEVKIPLLPDAHAYEGDTPLIEKYLQWAAGQVDRTKLQVIFSPTGRDQVGDQFTPMPYNNILKLLGPVGIPSQVRPGDQVVFELSKLRAAGGIQQHDASGLFYFNYKDDKGTQHTVWLENADSLSKQIALLLKYNLHGLALQALDSKSNLDSRVWDVLANYRAAQTTTLQSKLTLVWIVDGKNAGTSSASDPKFTWKAPNDTGQHTIDFALSIDDGKSFSPGGQQTALNISGKATSVPPTPAPTKQAAAPSQPKPQPTAKPVAPPAVAPVGGNHFGYGIQLDWTNKDRSTEIGQVKQLGFNWAKIQVRWCDMESSKGVADLGSIDDFVNRASGQSVKVLLSIVCAPAWSRGDGGAGGSGPPDNMQDAADFMGGLAGIYCDKGVGAIEVWNEHNLLTEWHGKPLSAALYMDMLKRSYIAIKAKCPKMIVVSGAPTPTGWNDGVVAIDDATFLEQLYQNGLKQYSDAIGAHPSGFNVPALCNALDPNCNRPGVSFTGPFTSRHHSWGFLATMTTYRNIMVKYGDGGKQVWPTEFGWPVTTGGTCGSGPCHPAGADNSPDQAAQWYVEAYQWGKQQSWVGVMIAWQLDFDRGELDAFRILGRPAFDRLAAMPK